MKWQDLVIACAITFVFVWFAAQSQITALPTESTDDFRWAADYDTVSEAVGRELDAAPVEVENVGWQKVCFGDHCEMRWVPEVRPLFPRKEVRSSTVVQQTIVTPAQESEVIVSPAASQGITGYITEEVTDDSGRDATLLERTYGNTGGYGSTGSAVSYGSTGSAVVSYGSTGSQMIVSAPVAGLRLSPVTVRTAYPVSYTRTYATPAYYGRPVRRVVSFPFRLLRMWRCR